MITLSRREVKQGFKSMCMEPKHLVMEQLHEKSLAIMFYVWEKKKNIYVVLHGHLRMYMEQKTLG